MVTQTAPAWTSAPTRPCPNCTQRGDNSPMEVTGFRIEYGGFLLWRLQCPKCTIAYQSDTSGTSLVICA
jgi:hypothetical protein